MKHPFPTVHIELGGQPWQAQGAGGIGRRQPPRVWGQNDLETIELGVEKYAGGKEAGSGL